MRLMPAVAAIMAALPLPAASAAAAPAAAHADVRTFVFAGPAAGGIAVAPGHAYDGRHGFEPGGGTLFSVAAPPGNYLVTVTLGPGETSIKAEARRLMLDRVRVPAGRTATRRFVVNVRDGVLVAPPDKAPGGTRVLLKSRERFGLNWDDRLTLEFLGTTPRAVSIAPAEVPTLFLLGDSTVTDQRAEPAASWGQMLTAFLKPDIAVANHAESGETLKSFVTALRFAKVLESVRPGDIAMIQFGHNDQKAQWPQTHAPADTIYRDWLRLYIAELRARGVTPILVTSPERRNWTGARIRPTLADYAAAVRAVGAAERVPVIDLNAASIALYEALGPERAPLAFSDGGRDPTHHDNYGAWLLARAVAAGLAGLPAGRHLADDLPAFDPARPPAPEALRLVASSARDDTRPDGS